MTRFQLFIWRTCVVLVFLTIIFAFTKIVEAVIYYSRQEPTAPAAAVPQDPFKKKKEIALTFDDGPHPEFTMKILSVLDEYNAKATFFSVGKMAEKYPALEKEIIKRGHEIGNHTYDHPLLTHLKKSEIENELVKGIKAIKDASGEDVKIFRPPSGRYDEEVLRVAKALGVKVIMWSVNSADYGCEDPKEVAFKVLAAPKDGDIVLMHSGVKATLIALPGILKALKDAGFEFKTVSGMSVNRVSTDTAVVKALIPIKQ